MIKFRHLTFVQSLVIFVLVVAPMIYGLFYFFVWVNTLVHP